MHFNLPNSVTVWNYLSCSEKRAWCCYEFLPDPFQVPDVSLFPSPPFFSFPPSLLPFFFSFLFCSSYSMSIYPSARNSFQINKCPNSELFFSFFFFSFSLLSFSLKIFWIRLTLQKIKTVSLRRRPWLLLRAEIQIRRLKPRSLWSVFFAGVEIGTGTGIEIDAQLIDESTFD